MAEKFAKIKYLPQFGAQCFVFGDIPVCTVSSAVADKILAAVNTAHEAAVEKAVKEAVEAERERCARIALDRSLMVDLLCAQKIA